MLYIHSSYRLTRCFRIEIRLKEQHEYYKHCMSEDIKVAAETMHFKIIHMLPKYSMSLLISKFRRDHILQQMFSSNNTWRTKAYSRSHSLALPGAIWRFCSFIAMPMFPVIFSFPLKNAWEGRGGKTLKRFPFHLAALFNNLSLNGDISEKENYWKHDSFFLSMHLISYWRLKD